LVKPWFYEHFSVKNLISFGEAIYKVFYFSENISKMEASAPVRTLFAMLLRPLGISAIILISR
jgi:hypothetical protein